MSQDIAVYTNPKEHFELQQRQAAVFAGSTMVLEHMPGCIQEHPWWKMGDMRLLVVNR